MLRKRAIRALLIEEIAGIRPPSSVLPEDAVESIEDDAAGGSSSGGAPSSAALANTAADAAETAAPDDPNRGASDELDAQLEALAHAERRAKLIIALDWLALVVLFVFRDTTTPFLPVDATIETIFTLGILAVAVHSGFRLGQLEKYRAVARAHEGLR